jgi:hypothetical protein
MRIKIGNEERDGKKKERRRTRRGLRGDVRFSEMDPVQRQLRDMNLATCAIDRRDIGGFFSDRACLIARWTPIDISVPVWTKFLGRVEPPI